MCCWYIVVPMIVVVIIVRDGCDDGSELFGILYPSFST